MRFNCPIYGQICIDERLKAYLDAPELQRLRRIRMGLTHYVYPSSTTTRFAHSLGVAHVAQLACDHLNVSRASRVWLCMQVAALYHDAGHVATSHFMDNLQLQVLGKGATDHEHRSTLVFRRVNDRIKQFTPAEANVVCAMITGVFDQDDVKECGGQPFVFRIVHNANTDIACGVDVDRLDYLFRDGSPCVLPTVAPYFLISTMGVGKNGDLVYDTKAQHEIASVQRLREHMHVVCYRHHTVLKVEKLLKQAIERCINVVDLFKDDKTMNWLQVTDTWLDYTLRVGADDIMQRIDTRDF